MREQTQPMIKSIALSVTGEFLLIIGVVFFLWGTSEFVTGFIGIDGSGKTIVGLILVVLAFILLFRSKALAPKMKVEKKEEEPSAGYR